MSKRFILEQQMYAKQFKDLEHEKRVSERLVDILNKGDDYSLRMSSLADALFNSGHLSVYDDDVNLDDLLSSIYQIKLDAHLNCFKALLKYAEENNHTSKESSFDLFDGNIIYIKSLKSGSRIFKTLIFETENLTVFGFVGVFKNDELIQFKAINIEWLSVRNDKTLTEKLTKELSGSLTVFPRSKAHGNTIVNYDFQNIEFRDIREVNEVISMINVLSSNIEIEETEIKFK